MNHGHKLPCYVSLISILMENTSRSTSAHSSLNMQGHNPCYVEDLFLRLSSDPWNPMLTLVV